MVDLNMNNLIKENEMENIVFSLGRLESKIYYPLLSYSYLNLPFQPILNKLAFLS